MLTETGKNYLPEILIIGCGRSIQHVDPELRRFIRSTGMKLEAVDSVYMFALIYEIFVLLLLALFFFLQILFFTLLGCYYCV